MQITTGKISRAQKCVIYGPEGIGKSTLASQFPRAIFIDTEGSTAHLDVARTPNPSSFSMLLETVKGVKAVPNICGTLIIDTVDWAEKLCMEELCSQHQKKGIEDFGYGKGYIYLAEKFGELLNLLTDLTELGINVVLTAHAMMRKFEQPDEMGAYDRWELKLQKKTAPLVKEWADMVLFCNYKTYIVNVDGQGAEKGKNKAQGGKRVIYTSHHPCWDAKNRHNLPEEMEMDYASIATCIPAGDTKSSAHHPEPSPEKPKDEYVNPIDEYPPTPATPITTTPPAAEPEIPDTVPKALADLMRKDGITVEEIQRVVADKGFLPANTPIENFPHELAVGWFPSVWPDVVKYVFDTYRDLPFK